MGRTRVLVVDDERFFREAIQDALTEAGLECILAADGAEALELADEPSIGAVVLDVRLPGTDGIEVLRRLREKRPLVRVIMLSASTDQELVLEALRLGACDYLAKPLHDEELVLSVQRALESFALGGRAYRLRGHLRALDERMARLASLGRRGADELESLQAATAEAVADVLDADKTSLMLLDEDGSSLRVAAAVGRKLATEEFDRVRVGEGVAGLALGRAESLLVQDVNEDSRFVDRGTGDRYDSPSFAVTPIVAGDRALGVLCATDARRRGPFDEDDLALLRVLAHQAAWILDGARPLDGSPTTGGSSSASQTVPLVSEAGPEADVTDLVRAVCEAMAGEVEPARLLGAALGPIAESLDATASLYLRDPETGDLVRESQAGDLEADRERVPAGRGLTGTVLETGRPVATGDPGADPRFEPDVDTPESGVAGPILCLPLTFRGKTLGVFRAFPHEAERASPQVGEALGPALSAAVRNVLLYRSLVESIEEVARARREARPSVR